MVDPRIFEMSYWFTTAPGPISRSTAYIFLVLFGVCIIAGVGSVFYRKKVKNLDKMYKDIYTRSTNALLTMGFLGLLWLFFSYETIPFFSGRYFFIVWFLGCISWAYLIYNYAVYEVPKRIQKRDNQLRMRKYMPRSRSHVS